MKNFTRHIFAFLAFASSAFANQDDVKVVLRPPTALFERAEPDRVKFFSDTTSRGNFGLFLHADEFHAWQFGVGIDFAVMSFSEWGLFRLGANFDGIADTNNDIYFRMGQTHYEVLTAFEYRLLESSVLYAGYRHRCRHAADKTPARILRRTGPEIGFNGATPIGPLNFQLAAALNAYLFAYDRPAEPRLGTSATLQVEWPLWRDFALFADGGVSITWIREEADAGGNLISDVKNATVRVSPGASLGLATKSGAADLRTYIAYNRNFDNGYPNAANQTHLFSANLDFLL